MENPTAGSEEKLRSLLENLRVGVYKTTPRGELLDLNMALVRIHGYDSPEELKKMNVHDLYWQEGGRTKRLEKLGQSASDMSEIQLKRKDGQSIWVRDYTWSIKGKDGRIISFDGILVDITKEKDNEAELKKVLRELEFANKQNQEMIKKLETISLMDDLTGLYNRRGFYLVTEEILKQAERNSVKMHLLFLDYNDLKKVNDSLGHKIGDQALARLAEVIKKTFRKSDIKGRIGGDEFTVLYVGVSSSGVRIAVDRLNDNIAKFNAAGEEPFQISISIGLSSYDPDRPSTLDALIAEADKQMYKHKRVTKSE